MKKIWIITQYALPPRYETRIRNNAMAKCLIKAGYDVTIFGASMIHNTNINLISDGSLYIKRAYGELKYIHVNAPMYTGNGIKRKLNMLLYPLNLLKTIHEIEDRPDFIINDLYVTAFNIPFKIAKYVNAPIITEVRDLWPESIVAYGYLKRTGIVARILYALERRMYIKSDRIVYTMEGWPDYVKEQGWEDKIDLNKATHINNGLDLQQFNRNREKYHFEDGDLSREDSFNVVYTGSIRTVNNVGKILDIAKLIKNPSIKFLIWGAGDRLNELKRRVIDEKIDNVIFKGQVEKKYIPSIVSQADLNFAHNEASELFRYGISFNKIFDYFAAGKPILCDFPCKYNPVVQKNAGKSVDSGRSDEIANVIEQFFYMDKKKYNQFCVRALNAAKDYDFSFLTRGMIKIIEDLNQKPDPPAMLGRVE